MSLKKYYEPQKLEVGIDEVGRGCLFGPIVIASVIWNPELDNKEITIKDSKKLSETNKLRAYEYICQNAIDIQVSFIDVDTIDKDNILQATMKGMHQCLDTIDIDYDTILVDGPHFEWYTNKKTDEIKHHVCVVDGDNTYESIACASIIAKVTRDNYIKELVKNNEELLKYDLLNNKGYGTKKHIEAIKQYGITKNHRKTFGICKSFNQK